MQNVTLVTGLFDLGRGSAEHLGPGFVRPFEHYLDHFARLLKVEAPMSVYIEPRHEPFVWQHRSRDNTRVFLRSVESFRTEFPFYDRVQQVRLDPGWRAQAAWLSESPQANLELYNPMVMSKMSMLHDQSIINPFETDHLVWIDAGIASTCGACLGDPRWVARLAPLMKKFLFLCFPYEGGEEVHGFAREPMASFARTDHVRWVARGGLFGGERSVIAHVNRLYHRWLEVTLAQGGMGTEESVFSIMVAREPERYHRFLLPDDGLILHFLDALSAAPCASSPARSSSCRVRRNQPPASARAHSIPHG